MNTTLKGKLTEIQTKSDELQQLIDTPVFYQELGFRCDACGNLITRDAVIRWNDYQLCSQLEVDAAKAEALDVEDWLGQK